MESWPFVFNYVCENNKSITTENAPFEDICDDKLEFDQVVMIKPLIYTKALIEHLCLEHVHNIMAAPLSQ